MLFKWWNAIIFCTNLNSVLDNNVYNTGHDFLRTAFQLTWELC